MKHATKNFSASELLSSGTFGDVYRGLLPSGAVVAVKGIRGNQEHGEGTFLAEATSLRQIRHRNLLQLRGWCHTEEGLFLVCDYMCNGSLDKWIYRNSKSGNDSQRNAVKAVGLSLNVRQSNLAGVASALDYLHGGWTQCVLHRDIKFSNVLLDADFNTYLGDFGLACLIDHHKLQKTTLLAGTLGYMAPEMPSTGRAKKDTDVYAFGILVLEVVCGRRPLDVETTDAADFVLLECVWRAHEAGNVSRVADSRLSKPDANILQSVAMAGNLDVSEYDSVASDTFQEKMMVANVLHLGLLCCHPNPSERPSMRTVNRWFQSSEVGAMELPPLPATNPQNYSQHSVSRSFSGGSSSSQSAGINRRNLQSTSISSTSGSLTT